MIAPLTFTAKTKALPPHEHTRTFFHPPFCLPTHHRLQSKTIEEENWNLFHIQSSDIRTYSTRNPLNGIIFAYWNHRIRTIGVLKCILCSECVHDGKEVVCENAFCFCAIKSNFFAVEREKFMLFFFRIEFDFLLISTSPFTFNKYAIRHTQWHIERLEIHSIIRFVCVRVVIIVMLSTAYHPALRTLLQSRAEFSKQHLDIHSNSITVNLLDPLYWMRIVSLDARNWGFSRIHYPLQWMSTFNEVFFSRGRAVSRRRNFNFR